MTGADPEAKLLRTACEQYMCAYRDTLTKQTMEKKLGINKLSLEQKAI